jgi:hypothetical protein
LHATLVGGASIFQAERHGDLAVRAEWGDERGCELIELFHHDLVIARVGIQKREDFASQCEINYLVNAWQRERILGTFHIKASIVNTHSPFPILLFYKDGISKPVGVIHFLDETSCQELGDLLTYGPTPLIIEIAQVLVHGLGTHPDAELMLGDLPRDA